MIAVWNPDRKPIPALSYVTQSGSSLLTRPDEYHEQVEAREVQLEEELGWKSRGVEVEDEIYSVRKEG